MPTTMPVGETSLDWTSLLLPGLIVAIISGCFALLGTLIVLRHERKKIRLQEMARLRWEKRWDVIGETYSLLAKVDLAFRAVPQPDSETLREQEIQDAHGVWKSFDQFYFPNCLFLPKNFDDRVRKISDEFQHMHSDFSAYSRALGSTGPQADEARLIYHQEYGRHQRSLVGGELEQRIRQLKDDLRAYLDQGETP